MNDIEDIIIINKTVFHEILLNNNLKIPENILKKYNELIKNNNCFNCKYDPKSVWEKKKAKTKIINSNINKLYLITSNISDDYNDKKKLTVLLNKITEINKNNILEDIKNIIENNKDSNDVLLSLLNIIYIFIGKNDPKNFNLIYIKILNLFDIFNKDILYNYMNNYIINNIWEPYEYIIKYNILDDKYYNDYCEYIKWKNNQLNIIKSFIYLYENNNKYLEILNILLNNINIKLNKYESENTNKYIIDYLLELEYIILDKIKNENIILNLKKKDLNKLENSTKFIIMNIIEKK
tara:strand:+ start:258 stop:1139 length:882 start_codon:yes stop_codon:yes gene_type:complete